MGLLGVIIGSTLGVLCSLIVGIIRLGKLKPIRVGEMTGIYRKLLSYGYKLYLNNILSHIQVSGGQFLIVIFLSSSQVAFYSMAQQLSQLIEKIPNAMGTFLFPRVTKEDFYVKGV